ncbi:MAG: hypothetical protein ACFE95_02710 [Candidatus Hodarchaeota archaeon]
MIDDVRSAKVQLFRLLKQKDELTENEQDLIILLEVDKDIILALNSRATYLKGV